MASILSRLSSLVPDFRPFRTPATRGTVRPRPSQDEKIATRAGVGRTWFLPYADSTATDDTPDIRAAMRKMLRDPYIKSAWLSQLLSVLSQPIQVHVPKGKKNRTDQARADFIRHCLEHAQDGMLGVGTAILMNHGSDGYTVSEKVWQTDARGKYANKVTLRALKPKDLDEHGRLIGDEHNNVTGVWSSRTNDTYPITDFVYTRYLHTFDEPMGMAAFRPSYGAYWARDTVRKLRIIHKEKNLDGLLMGTYEDPADKGPLEAALARARSSTWLSIPAGVRVEMLSKSQAAEGDYKSFDESLREESLVGIALAHLHILQGGVSDARGNTKVHKAVADLGPWLLTYIIQYAINRQIVPDLIDYNYGYSDEYPQVTLGGVSNAEVIELLQVLEGAQRAGFKPSKNYYATELTIQEADPNDPDDLLTPPAAGGMGGPGGGMGGMDLGGMLGGGGDPFSGGGAGGGGLPPGPPALPPAPTAGGEFGAFREFGPAGGYEQFGWDDWKQESGGKWKSPGGRVLSDAVFQRMKAKGGGTGAKPAAAAPVSPPPPPGHTTLVIQPLRGGPPQTLHVPTDPFAGKPRTRSQIMADIKQNEFALEAAADAAMNDGGARLRKAEADRDRLAAELNASPPPPKIQPTVTWQTHRIIPTEAGVRFEKVSEEKVTLSPPPPPPPPTPAPKPTTRPLNTPGVKLPPAALPSLYVRAGRQQGARYNATHKLAAEDGIWTDLKGLVVLPEAERKQYAERFAADLANPKKFVTPGFRKPPAALIIEQNARYTLNSEPAEVVGLKSYTPGNDARGDEKKLTAVVAIRSGSEQVGIDPFYYSAVKRRYPNAVWKLARRKPVDENAVVAWVGDKVVGLVMPLKDAAAQFSERGGLFDSFGETGHVETFGWDDWQPRDQYMVSPGGRVLKRDTWERMKAKSPQGGGATTANGRTQPAAPAKRQQPADRHIQARLDRIRGNRAETLREIEGDVRAAAAELATSPPQPAEVIDLVAAATPGLDTATQQQLGTKLAEATSAGTPEGVKSGFRKLAEWAAGLTGRAAVWAVRGLLTVAKKLLFNTTAGLIPPGTAELPGKVARTFPSVLKYVGVLALSAGIFAASIAAPILLPAALMYKLGVAAVTLPAGAAWVTWGMRKALRAVGREAVGKWTGYKILDDMKANPISKRTPRGDLTANSEGGAPQAGEEIALAGKDGKRAAELMGKSQKLGRDVLARVTEQAVSRLLADADPLDNTVLFTDEELQEIADSLAATTAAADLLGRSRVRRMAVQADEGAAEKFAEGTGPDPFDVFAEPPEALPPADAVDYFRRLVPSINLSPERYAPLLGRQAFTLAVAADQSLLNRVKMIILDQIEAGRRPQAVADIQDELDAAGVTPRNPQYAEMVYRTNMNDAYMQGFSAEMADPDVQRTFPVWQYLGIRDGRQGEDHEPHFDRYYNASQPFAEVRGPRVFNCRCSASPVTKFQWAELQAKGVRAEGDR